MRCVFYDMVRQRGIVVPKDCKERVVDSLSENGKKYPLCRKHYNAILKSLTDWLNGGGTFRHEQIAKRYFANHPEVKPDRRL